MSGQVEVLLTIFYEGMKLPFVFLQLQIEASPQRADISSCKHERALQEPCDCPGVHPVLSRPTHAHAQEGHTAHASPEEAEEMAMRMVRIYEKFAMEVCACVCQLSRV